MPQANFSKVDPIPSTPLFLILFKARGKEGRSSQIMFSQLLAEQHLKLIYYIVEGGEEILLFLFTL